jgi:hypothetical protein
MIKIIIEPVKMPPLTLRRFQKEFKNNKWLVIDTNDNSIRYKGSFENVMLACHNLNKEYYKNIVI